MYSKIVTDVFFDLDHTLWDFEKNSALTFEKILSDHHIGIELNDFLKVYVPANFQFWKLYREEKITKEDLRYQRLKTVFDALNYVVSDATINQLSEDYIQYLSSYNHLIDGTVEILEYLKPRYKLHIITNGFEEVQNKKMSNAGIYKYFEHIINSEMAGVKKPNPVIFQLALERAKVSSKCSIMIGDSIEADVIGAQAMGFHTIHFNSHNDIPHDYCPIIHDLGEIKSYL